MTSKALLFREVLHLRKEKAMQKKRGLWREGSVRGAAGTCGTDRFSSVPSLKQVTPAVGKGLLQANKVPYL